MPSGMHTRDPVLWLIHQLHDSKHFLVAASSYAPDYFYVLDQAVDINRELCNYHTLYVILPGDVRINYMLRYEFIHGFLAANKRGH